MNFILWSIVIFSNCFLFLLLTATTDSARSISNRRITDTSNITPVLLHTSTEQNHNERINRLLSSKQRINILPTYRGSTSTYDPSKSPLFSAGSRVRKFFYLFFSNNNQLCFNRDHLKTLVAQRPLPQQQQILNQMNFLLIIYWEVVFLVDHNYPQPVVNHHQLH